MSLKWGRKVESFRQNVVKDLPTRSEVSWDHLLVSLLLFLLLLRLFPFISRSLFRSPPSPRPLPFHLQPVLEQLPSLSFPAAPRLAYYE